jgi:hypothetical protein
VKRFVSLQFLNRRQSVGLLGRGISPSQDRYLTQTQNKHKQTSMPRVGFETTIPVFERAKKFHVLDCDWSSKCTGIKINITLYLSVTLADNLYSFTLLIVCSQEVCFFITNQCLIWPLSFCYRWNDCPSIYYRNPTRGKKTAADSVLFSDNVRVVILVTAHETCLFVIMNCCVTRRIVFRVIFWTLFLLNFVSLYFSKRGLVFMQYKWLNRTSHWNYWFRF